MLIELAGSGPGESYDAKDLSQRQELDVLRRLNDQFPELRDSALVAIVAFNQAEAEFERVKQELRSALGASNMQMALSALKRSAAGQPLHKAGQPPERPPTTVDDLPRTPRRR